MVKKNDTQQNPCSQSVPSSRHHNTREEGLEEGGGAGVGEDDFICYSPYCLPFLVILLVWRIWHWINY